MRSIQSADASLATSRGRIRPAGKRSRPMLRWGKRWALDDSGEFDEAWKRGKLQQRLVHPTARQLQSHAPASPRRVACGSESRVVVEKRHNQSTTIEVAAPTTLMQSWPQSTLAPSSYHLNRQIPWNAPQRTLYPRRCGSLAAPRALRKCNSSPHHIDLRMILALHQTPRYPEPRFVPHVYYATAPTRLAADNE